MMCFAPQGRTGHKYEVLHTVETIWSSIFFLLFFPDKCFFLSIFFSKKYIFHFSKKNKQQLWSGTGYLRNDNFKGQNVSKYCYFCRNLYIFSKLIFSSKLTFVSNYRIFNCWHFYQLLLIFSSTLDIYVNYWYFYQLVDENINCLFQ